MRCPVCSADHEANVAVCPITSVPIPATLEAVLGVRRLAPTEVLRLGLLVCDRWRHQGVALADIRPRNVFLGLDGAIAFATDGVADGEPEYVGLRALGGVLARSLDRTDPGANAVAGFLQELAGTPPKTRLALVRAEIHQRLAGGTDEDPLDAHTWADDAPSGPSDLDATVGMVPVAPAQIAESAVPAVDPSHPPDPSSTDTPSVDPYGDTYIRPRSEILPDMATDPTLHVSALTLDNSMPSVAAQIPGPAAEPLPTEVRPRPAEIQTTSASRSPMLLAVAAIAVAAVATFVVLSLG